MKHLWNRSFPFRIAIKTGCAMFLVMSFMIASAYVSVVWLVNRNTNSTLLMEAHSMISQWTQSGNIYEMSWHNGYYRIMDGAGKNVVRKGKYPKDFHDEHDDEHDHVPYSKPYSSDFLNVREDEHLDIIRQPPSLLDQLFAEKAEFREVYVPFTIGSKQYILSLATELKETHELLNTVLIIFISISVGGVILIMSVVSYSTINAFRPIKTIAEKIKLVEQNSLSTAIQLPIQDQTIQGLLHGLNAMLSRLHQSFVAQSRFVQDASHELRTPLAVLRSEIEVTLRRPRTEAEYQKSLQMCLSEVEHMSNVTTQLLTLARLDQSSKLDCHSLSIDHVIVHTIEKATYLMKSKQIDVIYIPQHLEVMGNEISLQILFSNLLHNAIHAIDSIGQIEIICKTTGAFIAVTVTDNGKGIPAESLPLLFDRFYRMDEARNRQSGGTGLGLSICKSIVEAHHGWIEVTSTVGQGSSFTVFLPISPEPT